MSKSFFDNRVAQKLRNKEKVSAAWLTLDSNLTAEIIAECGYDMAVVDMEHAQVSLQDLMSMIQAMKGTDCAPFVRAPWNDIVWCKQILDAGAYGIHVPYVSTREEAEKAVKYCKYAPEGLRGIAGNHRGVNFGMNKGDYFDRANRDVVVIAAIETIQGVNNIEEIVQVEGLDGIFIGPLDLSSSMGHLGHPEDEEVQKAIERIEEVVLKSDKFLGTTTPDMRSAQKLYEKGYTVVYGTSDVYAVVQTAKKEMEYYKTYIDPGK